MYLWLFAARGEKEMRIIYAVSDFLTVPGVWEACLRLGHEVAVYPQVMEEVEQGTAAGQRLWEFLDQNRADVVLSTMFYPILAQFTHELHIKYAVYGMDSPSYGMYWPEISRYENCILFQFDKKECHRMRQMGYQNVYYLPLAADMQRAQNLVITDEEIMKYQCDVAFVGSLYSNFYNKYDKNVNLFSVKQQQKFADIFERAAFYWDGVDRLGEMLTEDVMDDVKKDCPEMFDIPYDMPPGYYFKQMFLARKLTNIERTLMVQMLAQRYDFRLYTWEEECVPNGVARYPAVRGEECLKALYSGKINLNITMRSIESGVPQRIYDIMSVGAFVLTSWSEEIPQLFEEGKEIVTFKTPEEMLQKIDYYLTHEKERLMIGYNGYKKVEECYSYEKQMEKMLRVVEFGENEA